MNHHGWRHLIIDENCIHVKLLVPDTYALYLVGLLSHGFSLAALRNRCVCQNESHWHRPSGGASLLLMAGHRQVISRISKDSQNIFTYDFIIITFDCQGGSQGEGIYAKAFALAYPGLVPPLPWPPLSSRGVQCVHWVMHKCIMVKEGGKGNTHKVCKKHANFSKTEGKFFK